MGLKNWLVCPECGSDDCDYSIADPDDGSLKLRCNECGNEEWIM